MIFEVNRQDLQETRTVEASSAELGEGQIRLAIERFAFTTNNVTYAVAGDMLDYWGFFPAEAPFGRVPAMGLATVSESNHPGIETGGRYFGFYPMGAESIITAEVRGDAFRDIGAHRGQHAQVYTDFRNVDTDPMFRASQADEYLLLWGLFMTSFLVDDYLADNDFHGATQTLVTSASSKTSIALAACLAHRDGHHSIGLTSARNLAFVEGLGLYDQVITYDQVGELDAGTQSALVDMAGNAAVRASVHDHFAGTLTTSLTVGATHWDEPPAVEPLAGPTPEFFFAPAQSAKRSQEWGPDELAQRIATSFHALLDGTSEWLNVEHRIGGDGIDATYRELLNGSADPSSGFICSMTPIAE